MKRLATISREKRRVRIDKPAATTKAALVLLGLMVLQSFSPVAQAAFTQSAFRFAINLDAANPSALTSNPSSLDDTIKDSVIDTANAVFYVVGHTSTNWVIEKRSELHGSGIAGFGTGGQIIQDVASSVTEEARAVAVDPSGGYIYVAGFDEVPLNRQWRIEKRRASDGALCTAANCGTAFGTGGVVQTNPASGADVINALVLDRANGYIYAAGHDATGDGLWRIEKRRASDGALCTAANCGTAFGTDGVVTNNPSGGPDHVNSIALDVTNSYLFVTGLNDGNGANKRWRVNKYNATTGALCTAAACGTLFRGGVSTTDGVYESNPTNNDDQAREFQVDGAGNAIFIGGYDNDNGRQWRVEKIDSNTAAPITAFGTSGAITSNPSAGSDELVDLELDGSGGFLYAIGTDANTANQRWRVEKRDRTTGALCTAANCGTEFGTGGIVTSDPSGNNDPAARIMIDIERTFLWALGGDRTLGATDARWRIEQYQLDDGDYWLAPQDTKATASSTISFRLRLLIHTDTTVLANAATFKLQYAAKSGTCDTGFVGETYVDLTSTSNEVRYYDNPTLADGAAAVAITGEPIHSGHTRVLQTIEEANNFTNPNAILLDQDGTWDFVMQDNLAFGAYCFRAITSAGSTLATYTVIPEITFCKDLPQTDALLRHGTYFCEGIKKNFFWSK